MKAPNITVIVWTRTELENYLLDADTIARVSGAAPGVVARHIGEECSRLQEVTRAAFTATWVGAVKDSRGKEVMLLAENSFDTLWSKEARRVEIVRGTRLIQELNVRFELDGYRPISGYILSKAIRPQSLAPEVRSVLLGIDDMLR